MHRNTGHGTFLTRDQFVLLFETSAGKIPKPLVTVANFLVFGLLADPARFLAWRPASPGR